MSGINNNNTDAKVNGTYDRCSIANDGVNRPHALSSPMKSHRRSDSCGIHQSIPEECSVVDTFNTLPALPLPMTSSTPNSTVASALNELSSEKSVKRGLLARMKKSASLDPPSPVSPVPPVARMRRSASDTAMLHSSVQLQDVARKLTNSLIKDKRGLVGSASKIVDGAIQTEDGQPSIKDALSFEVDWSALPSQSTRSRDSSQSDYMDSLSSSYGGEQGEHNPLIMFDSPDHTKDSQAPDTSAQSVPKESGKTASNGHVSDSSARSNDPDKNLNVSIKGSGSKSAEKKKKGSYWYNVLSPTYKSRSEDFKKAFKDIPTDERLIVDYSCAMQKDILVHGRLYVTPGWICFYANIFRWETVLKIRCRDITAMTKEKTARVIPNAIQISTKDDKYFFTSFGARDKTYLMMFRVWQNALCDQQMNSHEIWQWVHYSYGEELGLTSSDDDYIAPTVEDEAMFHASLQQDESMLSNDHGGHGGDPGLSSIKFSKYDERIDFIAPSSPKEPDDDRDPAQLSLNDDLSLTVPHLPNADNTSLTATTVSTDDGPSFVVPQRTLHKHEPASNATTGAGHKKKHTCPPTSLLVPGHADRASTGDLPTDMGDTTEDDDGEEVRCSGHEHLDLVGVDDVLSVNVDSVFDMLFTNSKFYADFTKSRKTFDVVHGAWPERLDETGEKRRSLNYVLSLNYSIGPKSSPLAETQICREFKPGKFYMVDTECVNSGIPYGDNFYVINRYCLSRLGPTKTRVLITSQIKYRKSVWGFVKNFIEKNATQGIIESFSVMGEMLQQEALKQEAQLAAGQPNSSLGRKKVLRRRKNSDRQPTAKHKQPAEAHKPVPPLQNNLPPKHTPHRGVSVSAAEEGWQMTLTADTIVRIVCFILVVLVLFNLVLFYKLWILESKASSIQRSFIPSHKYPKEAATGGVEDWQEILSRQQHLHHEEIERWKEVLSSSVQLLEHMRLSLIELHSNIDKHIVPHTTGPDNK